MEFLLDANGLGPLWLGTGYDPLLQPGGAIRTSPLNVVKPTAAVATALHSVDVLIAVSSADTLAKDLVSGAVQASFGVGMFGASLEAGYESSMQSIVKSVKISFIIIATFDPQAIEDNLADGTANLSANLTATAKAMSADFATWKGAFGLYICDAVYKGCSIVCSYTFDSSKMQADTQFQLAAQAHYGGFFASGDVSAALCTATTNIVTTTKQLLSVDITGGFKLPTFAPGTDPTTVMAALESIATHQLTGMTSSKGTPIAYGLRSNTSLLPAQGLAGDVGMTTLTQLSRLEVQLDRLKDMQSNPDNYKYVPASLSSNLPSKIKDTEDALASLRKYILDSLDPTQKTAPSWPNPVVPIAFPPQPFVTQGVNSQDYGQALLTVCVAVQYANFDRCTMWVPVNNSEVARANPSVCGVHVRAYKSTDPTITAQLEQWKDLTEYATVAEFLRRSALGDPDTSVFIVEPNMHYGSPTGTVLVLEFFVVGNANPVWTHAFVAA